MVIDIDVFADRPIEKEFQVFLSTKSILLNTYIYMSIYLHMFIYVPPFTSKHKSKDHAVLFMRKSTHNA